MGRYNHLPIFQMIYRLNIDIYRATEQFPREHKYTLGQRLKELVLDLLTDIVAANQQQDKRKTLADACLSIEQVRIHIRLAFDLKILGMRPVRAPESHDGGDIKAVGGMACVGCPFF